jgi:chorismate dehydratase
MRINLGMIPYLNTSVFYQDFPLDLVNVVDLVPSSLSRAARRGEVDVGAVPIVTCFELEEQFMPLRDFGLAVENKARSVLLLSKRPIEELDGARIALTGESSTSVRLLKILLRRRYEVQPAQYVSTKEVHSDAILLIGDAALNNRAGLPSYSRVYDLGEIWRAWTGLPFVFARWIVRRDLNPEAVEFLGQLLEKSLARGMQRIEQIAASRSDLSMTVAEVSEYLHGFNYVFGPRENESIALFRKYIDAEGERPAALKEAPNAG